MIQITNGKNIFTVSRGAFEEIFQRQGFQLYDAKTADNNDGTDESAGSDPIAAILEKPLAQWSKNDIKVFSESEGIDMSGTKNLNEAREVIKDFLGTLS